MENPVNNNMSNIQDGQFPNASSELNAGNNSGALKGADNMPLGLGMALGMNSFANGYWSTLDTSQKSKVVKYIQNNAGGNDAKKKVDTAIYALEHHNLDLLSK